MTITLVKISCMNDRLIPLGLACLQAYLKKHKIDVKVFNFRTSKYNLPKVASDPLIQLKPPVFIMNHQDFPILVSITDCIFKDQKTDLNQGVFPDILKDYSERLAELPSETQKRFESIIDYVKGIIPQITEESTIIGFSVNYLNIPETVITSAFIKRINPNIQVILGGPSITQSKDAFELLLLKGVFDGLVVGEGEAPILEIAKGVPLQDIKGVVSVNEKRAICFSLGTQLDLDSLPTPDYTNIPLNSYFEIASVYRSRGCTHRCKFCAEWKLFGPKFRVRSIEKVIEDIRTIIKNHKPKYMIFGESLVNDDLTYFEDLCDAMIEQQFNIKFGTHFRANISPELARKAYSAGFNDAWVGFEAFSDEDLKQMNKGTNVHQNITTIQNLTQAGVNVIAMLVVGFSNLEEEKKNNANILEIINKFSLEKYIDEKGETAPLSIQWRPAPMYLVPGSFDYKEKLTTCTRPWTCRYKSYNYKEQIEILEQKISDIPYEFERPIPDDMVGMFMKKIQQADRELRFAIGGLAKHIINFLMETKRKNRKKRQFERIGVIAQRLGEEVVKTKI
ncbi:MAG: B12-binding domain-containing radical SAM protein [Promethearchaeota archaeon]